MFVINCPPKLINLGHKGENKYTTISMDMSSWLSKYPNGEISLVYQRPDGEIYSPEVITQSGITDWVVTDIDTACHGNGVIEYRIVVDDMIGKSIKIQTNVLDSLHATTDSPTPPAPDWIVEAAKLKSQIGTLLETSGGTYTKPTGGIPKSDLDSGVQSSLDKADSALQEAPVTSVNGKTGDVALAPSDLGLGSIFELKGSKPTYSALPSNGNEIGDVWYIKDESVGYIWLNDGSVDRWEQLGMEIDLSLYRTSEQQDAIDEDKQNKITSVGLLKGDGLGGITAAVEGVDYLTIDTLPKYDGGVR